MPTRLLTWLINYDYQTKGIPLLWRCIFIGHMAVAIIWWLIEPQGFPIVHRRFWANLGVPLIVVGMSTIGILGTLQREWRLLTWIAPLVPAATIGAAISARLLYPITFSNPRLLMVGGFLLFGWLLFLVALVWLTFRQSRGSLTPWWHTAICVGLASLFGAFVPWTQQGADPSTIPRNAPLPQQPRSIDSVDPLEPIAMSDRVTVWPTEAFTTIECGQAHLSILPVLTFNSRSPDRFWTLLAPLDKRRGPIRTITGYDHEPESLTMSYVDDADSWLRVESDEESRSVNIEAYSEVSNSIYSHLNYFTQIHVSFEGALTVSFSPTADAQFEVLPAGYPIGRPARLAYVDENELFRVVEARSGEKGPFRTLAEGIAAPKQPMQLTLYIDGRPACRIDLVDWKAQASRALSPTAGWGLPQNAIEFRLFEQESYADEDSHSFAFINISLAATSVGRGYDSVGHTAGIYRNRIKVEPLGPDRLR